MPHKTLIRTLLVFVVLVASMAALSAWEIDQAFGSNFAYYLDDHKGYPEGGGFLAPSYSPLDPVDDSAWTGGPFAGWTSDDPEARKLGSGWGAVELEAFYRYRAKMPFLQGSGPLTADNNLTLIAKPVITPVSIHLEGEVHWTPIAFLKIQAGFLAGTGWPLSFLGLHGLALNDADDITDTTVSGFVGQVYFGGTFQFDLAAVVPGEYNHVVISATSKARYIGYSQADSTQAWYWRADSGRNFNGWEYRGDYALGWMAPWRVNFIGLVAEHRFWLSKDIKDMSTIDSGGWGSDLHDWRFGPAVNVALKEDHGLTILLQFKNGLYYTEDTVYARWFDNWSATGDKYVKWDRLALAYTWNL